MAFGFCIFIFALLYERTGSQSTTTDALQETDFEGDFKSQVNGDNVTTSSAVTHTDNFEGHSVKEHYSSSATDAMEHYSSSVTDVTEHYSSSATDVTEHYSSSVTDVTEHYSSSVTDVTTPWENSNTSGESIPTEKETLDTLPNTAPFLELGTSGTFTRKSSEVDIISFGEEPGDKSDQSNEVNKSTTASQPLHSGSRSNEGTDHLSPDVSNITVTTDDWISTYSTRESRDYKLNSSSEVQEDILILLRSNCSIVNTENIPLNDIFADVGCTIYLRINISLENGTRDKLLSSLERLTLKPSNFQVVKVHDQAEDASRQKQQKHHNYLFGPETFAYLAVAFCFAFLLLLAIIVFGFRCFKKRKPSSDVSAFDVKLSSYTLTRIPRASLTSVDCSPGSDSLDDKTESPSIRSKNCGSCESGLDIPCDTFSSNREMKTFGVSRSRDNRNVDSPSDVYPQHSAIAYENHTFQRYF